MQQEETPDLDLRDQYIAILVEFYGVKREILTDSPIDRAKLRYWQKILALFERLRPEQIRNRAKYRADRAETKDLNPVQIAVVRYAWGAFHAADEDGEAVLKRWEAYLYGGPAKSNGNTTDYEQFRHKRQFKEMVRGIQAADLWPWD